MTPSQGYPGKFGLPYKDEHRQVSCRILQDIMKSANQGPLREDSYAGPSGSGSEVESQPSLSATLDLSHSFRYWSTAQPCIKPTPNTECSANESHNRIEYGRGIFNEGHNSLDARFTRMIGITEDPPKAMYITSTNTRDCSPIPIRPPTVVIQNYNK
jgi:hypothetical protein